MEPNNVQGLQAKVQDALKRQKCTENITIKGIQIRGERMKVVTADGHDARILRDSEKWMDSIAKEARILGGGVVPGED